MTTLGKSLESDQMHCARLCVWGLRHIPLLGVRHCGHNAKTKNYQRPRGDPRFRHVQIEPAERYLDANFGGPKPRSYAYTCGFEGLGRGETVARVRRYVEVLSSTFVAARTVNGPPNDPQEVMAQRYFLSGFEPTYDSDDPHLALANVEKAIHRGHWAILVFHEVLDARKASGDTSKAVHRTILEHISRQPVWCAPMRTVFGHVTGHA